MIYLLTTLEPLRLPAQMQVIDYEHRQCVLDDIKLAIKQEYAKYRDLKKLPSLAVIEMSAFHIFAILLKEPLHVVVKSFNPKHDDKVFTFGPNFLYPDDNPVKGWTEVTINSTL